MLDFFCLWCGDFTFETITCNSCGETGGQFSSTNFGDSTVAA
ncbi:hypothetical protein FHT40_002709 [Mycolicibacterium sp. BK556]|nr:MULTISPECIES: hypothetical protein [Mycobacteriaceae]MBB3603048.1 hypothetical protein [Mycolicibacterium sp. BK556]MBB3633243.1 hypothetical protein [Mycolicibacterium sp. BK607]TDO07217.1 hypothetical protein EV580_6182 [Mycobacterium sp. BK086]